MAEDKTGLVQVRSSHLPLAVFVLVLAVYLFTLPPCVVVGDSGEIVEAAWKLVFARPPGYPLITLGHVFCHYVLPAGEPAWRMGVLNAIFGTGTSSLLVMLMVEVSGCPHSFASCNAIACIFAVGLAVRYNA